MRTVRVRHVGQDMGPPMGAEALGYGGIGVLLLIWALTEYGHRRLK
jgi:hypothetical protein